MYAPVASFEALYWRSLGETDNYTNTADKAVAVPALIQQVRRHTACISYLSSCCSCLIVCCVSAGILWSIL